MNYWINTATNDLVNVALKGNFTQTGRKRHTDLEKLSREDLLVFYSPRTESWGGDPLQAFTAIGQIIDDEPYQVTISQDLHKWRRQINFFDSHVASIRYLIEKLDFIKDKIHWGEPFHHGLFKIGKGDFERIAQAMEADIEITS